jgi:type IV pilus assembly protein PilB
MGTPEKDIFPNKPLLGEILIKRNLLKEQELQKALEFQKKDNKYLGDILVDLGFVEERDIVVALVLQYNFAYIAVDRYEIDSSIIQLVSKDVAHKLKVIPLDRVGDVLSLVMVNPLDVSAKKEIQGLTNCQVAPFIATKQEVVKALDRWY